MTVYRSESIRSQKETCYYAKEPLIEVDMSVHQFAQVITTLNVGHGIPVTLNRLGKEGVEECPEVNERELFTEEFEEDIKQTVKAVNTLAKRADEILSNKAIKVSERSELRKIISSIQRDINSNMPSANKMFQESMDRSVTASKLEIESFWCNMVTQLGVKELGEKYTPPKLTEGESRLEDT